MMSYLSIKLVSKILVQLLLTGNKRDLQIQFEKEFYI